MDVPDKKIHSELCYDIRNELCNDCVRARDARHQEYVQKQKRDPKESLPEPARLWQEMIEVYPSLRRDEDLLCFGLAPPQVEIELFRQILGSLIAGPYRQLFKEILADVLADDITDITLAVMEGKHAAR